MKKNIPNIITLLNLFVGCFAVVQALKGNVQLAGLSIVVCSLLDFFDGFLARILKAGSSLGQQLDSLADLISFGMAPAAIVFFYMEQAAGPGQFMSITPYLAFIITAFSGLRLAIFNIDTKQSTSFIGMPTPANALFFASFPIVLFYGGSSGFIYSSLLFIINDIWFLLTLTALFSWLLVSPIRMFSLKFSSLKWKENKIRFTFIIVAILLFLVFQIGSIPLVAIFYIILSTIQHFVTPMEQ